MDKKLTRKLFRDSVFKRDGHKCVFCIVTQDLDAHHIMDRHYFTNGGYVLQNGITWWLFPIFVVLVLLACIRDLFKFIFSSKYRQKRVAAKKLLKE